MVEALEQQARAFATEVRKHGVINARQLSLPTDKVTKVIRQIYSEVGLFYARKTIRDIESSTEQKAGFGLNEELTARILEYLLSNFLMKSVREIADTTRAELLEIIERGEREGWGVDRMAREINDSDFPLWRSRMIVRTELGFAMNAGQQAGKDESEWESVDTWVSTHDFRTRTTHREVDGKSIRPGEKFAVRKRRGGYDMMTGPGDPTASAGNVIQCRCTVAIRALRDANGRLVRKRKISVILPGEIRRPATTLI